MLKESYDEKFDNIEYDLLKMVLAILEYEYGIEGQETCIKGIENFNFTSQSSCKSI